MTARKISLAKRNPISEPVKAEPNQESTTGQREKQQRMKQSKVNISKDKLGLIQENNRQKLGHTNWIRQ